MTLDRSRAPDALAPLPDELEQAVAGLRAFVEPTPEQLELSFRRVRQAVGALSPAAAAPQPASPPALEPAAGVAPPLAQLPPPAAAAARASAWRVHWALPGVTAMAMLAGFAAGRWTRPAAPSATAHVNVVAASSAVALVGHGAPEAQHPEPAAPVIASDPADGPAPEGPLTESPAVAPTAGDSSAGSSSADSPVARNPGSKPATRKRASGPAARIANTSERPCPPHDPIVRAECFLRRDQPQLALTTLRGAPQARERDHERASGLTLLARCRLGNDVRALGQQFFASWPSSSLIWRIRNECPSAEPEVAGTLRRADVKPALTR